MTGRQLGWLQQTEVVMSDRLRTTLGRAYLQKNRIELNAALLEKYPHELEPTFAHELAHLVAPMLYGRAGLAHQIGWKKVMHLFGYPPERTHKLPVGEKKRPHRVMAHASCGCPERVHKIKPVTFRKMRYGRRRYICLKCKTEIQLKL